VEQEEMMRIRRGDLSLRFRSSLSWLYSGPTENNVFLTIKLMYTNILEKGCIIIIRIQ
jgi:hypothetical protein